MLLHSSRRFSFERAIVAFPRAANRKREFCRSSPNVHNRLGRNIRNSRQFLPKRRGGRGVVAASDRTLGPGGGLRPGRGAAPATPHGGLAAPAAATRLELLEVRPRRAPATARGGPRTARGARRRGQPAGSSSAGRSGSRNGNFRQAWTSSVCIRKHASARRGPDAAKSSMNASYASRTESRSQASATSRSRPPERAERRHERGGFGGRRLPDRRRELGLALDVRRQPHAAAHRSEPGPGQAGAELVADLAPLLGDAEDHDQPPAVPSPRSAERVDALGAGPQQLGRAVAQRHPGAATVALGLEPAVAARCGRAPDAPPAACIRPRPSARRASPATPPRRAAARTRRGSSAAATGPPGAPTDRLRSWSSMT